MSKARRALGVAHSERLPYDEPIYAMTVLLAAPCVCVEAGMARSNLSAL